MSHASIISEKAVPAQLRFLAIYNPSLGQTEETRHDQIVYYFPGRTRKSRGKDTADKLKEEENEQLRHIGLAQGIVEFGKSFSQDKSVDTIETERSRIILHELEAGWWILASIDLTQLSKALKPLDMKNGIAERAIEYSSREVKPPVLLLRDLLRAHSIFLLHHSTSMSALFSGNRRSKFTNLLGRYWNEFLSTWNVMLHGNPAISVYSGIKISGSGELGMGVGEEDRGSGEREVLEGFVGRIDGLVDLVVSRFGPISADAKKPKNAAPYQIQSNVASSESWLGTGLEPGSNDGAIFLGVGAISRKSLRDITHWMEDIYSWGPQAYGLNDIPVTRRRHRKGSSKNERSGSTKALSTQVGKANPSPTAIYTSEVSSSNVEGNKTTNPIIDVLNIKPDIDVPEPRAVDEAIFRENESHPRSKRSHSASSSNSSKSGTLVDYLKLGYGTHWSLGGSTAKLRGTSISTNTSSLAATPETRATAVNETSRGRLDKSCYPTDDPKGHYLVGLPGDLETEGPEISGSEGIGVDIASPRIMFRTVTVELSQERNTLSDENLSTGFNTADGQTVATQHDSLHLGTSTPSPTDNRCRNKKELRVVVYAIKPFIFTLLFDISTKSLSKASVYRSLHYQLEPLQRPLSASTTRKLPRPNLGTTWVGDAKIPIYDIVWDPEKLTIWSTVPDIPSPATNLSVWSRLEALNTHMQILNTFAATRYKSFELEQTCKTSRGYWVVWTRIPNPEAAEDQKSMSQRTITPIGSNATTEIEPTPHNVHISDRRSDTDEFISQASNISDESEAVNGKEIFLVRKSSDPATANAFVRESANTPAKLAQGIGVDTKTYIEQLLDMYR